VIICIALEALLKPFLKYSILLGSRHTQSGIFRHLKLSKCKEGNMFFVELEDPVHHVTLAHNIMLPTFGKSLFAVCFPGTRVCPFVSVAFNSNLQRYRVALLKQADTTTTTAVVSVLQLKVQRQENKTAVLFAF
jgi:hypothetical protein